LISKRSTSTLVGREQAALNGANKNSEEAVSELLHPQWSTVDDTTRRTMIGSLKTFQVGEAQEDMHLVRLPDGNYDLAAAHHRVLMCVALYLTGHDQLVDESWRRPVDEIVFERAKVLCSEDGIFETIDLDAARNHLLKKQSLAALRLTHGEAAAPFQLAVGVVGAKIRGYYERVKKPGSGAKSFVEYDGNRPYFVGAELLFPANKHKPKNGYIADGEGDSEEVRAMEVMTRVAASHLLQRRAAAVAVTEDDPPKGTVWVKDAIAYVEGVWVDWAEQHSALTIKRVLGGMALVRLPLCSGSHLFGPRPHGKLLLPFLPPLQQTPFALLARLLSSEDCTSSVNAGNALVALCYDHLLLLASPTVAPSFISLLLGEGQPVNGSTWRLLAFPYIWQDKNNVTKTNFVRAAGGADLVSLTLSSIESELQAADKLQDPAAVTDRLVAMMRDWTKDVKPRDDDLSALGLKQRFMNFLERVQPPPPPGPAAEAGAPPNPDAPAPAAANDDKAQLERIAEELKGDLKVKARDAGAVKKLQKLVDQAGLVPELQLQLKQMKELLDKRSTAPAASAPASEPVRSTAGASSKKLAAPKRPPSLPSLPSGVHVLVETVDDSLETFQRIDKSGLPLLNFALLQYPLANGDLLHSLLQPLAIAKEVSVVLLLQPPAGIGPPEFMQLGATMATDLSLLFFKSKSAPTFSVQHTFAVPGTTLLALHGTVSHTSGVAATLFPDPKLLAQLISAARPAPFDRCSLAQETFDLILSQALLLQRTGTALIWLPSARIGDVQPGPGCVSLACKQPPQRGDACIAVLGVGHEATAFKPGQGLLPLRELEPDAPVETATKRTKGTEGTEQSQQVTSSPGAAATSQNGGAGAEGRPKRHKGPVDYNENNASRKVTEALRRRTLGFFRGRRGGRGLFYG